MIKSLLLAVATLVFLNVHGQQTAQLSPNLRLWLSKNQTSSNQQIVKYKQGNTVYLSVLAKVNLLQINPQELNKLGIKIGTKAGDIFTLQVPEKQISNIVKLKGILYVQLDEPVATNLDPAKRSSRVDSVHRGINLPMAYTGKNVVVGIIDAGFDYGHPTFYDTLGNVLRVKRVWEQRKAGTPPTGFNYGNEVTDTATMLSVGNDVSSFSHGTHVGGIAAGSGIGSLFNTRGRGVAYESDLVFVGIKPNKSEWTGAGMSSIIDAVNYIFTYAASVGKPAVANLSWGCSIGPNDGSSLFSQALNNLVGPGKIFVNSAGNNGDENIHWSNKDTVVSGTDYSFVSFPNVVGEKRTWVDVWGEKNKALCVNLLLYRNGNIIDSCGTICVLNNESKSGHLIGTNGDTLYYSLTTANRDFNNQKTHVLMDLHSKTNDSLCIKLNHEGKFNAWMGYVNDYNGYYGSFTNGRYAWASNGNSQYTLGEMSCAPAALTVAAYVSKISYRNLAGAQQSFLGYATTNAIAPFSSIGPTADGRMKPDIAAPGMTIASGVNSYDVSYAPGGGNYNSSVAQYQFGSNNRTYYYAEASGTSMSAPMFSGMVALLLQANPILTPQKIKEILSKTAYKDNFTTNTPDSTRWGYGKANAYGMIKEAILLSGINETPNHTLNNLSVYPNPSSGSFWVEFETIKAGNTQIMVCDVMGKTVFETLQPSSTGLNKMEITPLNLSPGMYVLKVKANGVEVNRRLMVE
jgi:subtilisin family serine protease